MQRIFNVDKWTVIEEGHSLAFLNDRPRNVRLDVNAPSETQLWYICQETGETFFLALVKGRDVVEFGSVGPFEITAKGGFVSIFTNDGDDIAMQPTAHEAYVKVMERRARNPELEHMMYIMESNMRMRLEAQANELSNTFERRLAEATAPAVGTGNAGDALSQPAQAGSANPTSVGTEANTGDQNNETSLELKEPPRSYADALKFLRNEPFLRSPRHKAQHWRADRAGAHSDILAFERAFIRRFRRLGIPVFAHCVQRSDAVQQRHYVTGVSKAKPGSSPHNHGRAVDLVHGTRAWNIPKPCWDLFGHVGKEVAAQLGVKVVWGGDWSFYDPAHWELEDWRHYPSDPAVEKTDLDALLAFYGAE